MEFAALTSSGGLRAAVVALLLVTMPVVHAQDVRFTATVDRNNVAVGDPIKLTIELVNSQASFGHPELGGLSLINGPFEGSSFTNVNGRMSMSVTRTYVLTATAPGDYTIAPLTVRAGKGSVSTTAIKVHVVKAAGSPGDRGAAPPPGANRDLYATITLSKSKAYVGEAVIATYTLFTRYNALDVNDLEYPTLSGFWAEEIDLGGASWEQQLRVINGLQYRAAVLKKQVLFPQKSGDLRVPAMTLTCTLNRGWLNPGSQVTIKSNEASLKAIDLPAGRPADHSGAVGDLNMQVVVDRTELKANEAIDLKVRISGQANLKLIQAPAIAFPVDLESYDPKTTDRINVNGGGMSGSREFQYLVIPRHEGEYVLPPITFSFFDPEKAMYRTLRGDTLRFHVSAGDAGGSATIGRPSHSDVRQLDKDIRTVKVGDPELRPRDHYLFMSWPWSAGMAAPPLLFALVLAWSRKRDRDRADAVGQRRKRADKLARQRLKAAAQALTANDRGAFYEALGRALEGYFADKFGLGVAEVTPAAVRRHLGSIEAGAIADRYVALLERCGMARYAPVEETPREQLYEEAAGLIGTIENSLRA